MQTATADVTVVAGEAGNPDMTLAYGGEIEVRGSPLLEGQAKALNTQMNTINITNIVAADQIGRFPDKNAAEATQRIPGVSLNRDMGEGRYIIIRGTEARLNSTTVNGERIPSPEAGVRNVALDTIPADLLGSIEVSKALRPDMDGDSIGGTVDLVTLRAPEEIAPLGVARSWATARSWKRRPRTGASPLAPVLVSRKTGVCCFRPAAATPNEAPTTSSRSTTTAISTCSKCATTPPSGNATAAPSISIFGRPNVPITICAVCGPITSTPSTVARKTTWLPTTRSRDPSRNATQTSYINSFTFGGENNIGESFVLDYRLMWNKSQEETPNQYTSAFVMEDVVFDPNVSPDHIDPNNIQANPLNERADEFWFDSIEDQSKKRSRRTSSAPSTSPRASTGTPVSAVCGRSAPSTGPRQKNRTTRSTTSSRTTT